MATQLQSVVDAPARSISAFRIELTTPTRAAILLLLVAIAARIVQFGNPVIQVDDQFYLLVGDRLWQGALPYVDIWDRKPIGLFLIYGAIRALGGDGVLQYQIVATLFAAATAIVVHRLAGRISPPRGALAAGIIYLVSLGMFGGEGGQSPVFYNLPVALAALATIRVVERPTFYPRSRVDAALAMLLMGLAIQIKYTALFEGAYLGLVLLWKARQAGMPPHKLVAATVLWVGLGVLPTGLAWAVYAAIGHGDAFVFANFTSIFERGNEPADMTFGRLAGMTAKILPLAYTAAVGLWPTRRRGEHPAAELPIRYAIAGWVLASIAGVLVFGSYFDHYALPMLLPLSVAAAPVLGDPSAGVAIVARGRRHLIPGAVFLVLLLGGISITTISKNRKERGTGREVAAMADFLRPRLADCLFVYDGEPILYKLTNSCLPTRWPFPDHLNNRREDGAVGIDALAETKRIIATRPHFVVTSDVVQTKMNMKTWTYMRGELARDYHPVGAWRIGSRDRVIYERLAGH